MNKQWQSGELKRMERGTEINATKTTDLSTEGQHNFALYCFQIAC